MKLNRSTIQRVIGVSAVAAGVIWTLQGLGYLAGSVMSGVTLWAIVGPIVAAGGVYLLLRSRRPR